MAGTVEERLQRLEDAREVENLMGRFAYYIHCAEHEKILELYSRRPDVSAEVTSHGVFRGPEGIRRLYLGFLLRPRFLAPGSSAEAVAANELQRKRVGRLTVHQLTTPVIEIANDGQTAKGLWMSPGSSAHHNEKGELQAYWVWGKWAADFIKEDGTWKIWHLNNFITFRTKYEQGWVKDPGTTYFEGPDAEFPPDAPPTYHRMYDPNGVIEQRPPVPEPY